MSISQSSLGSSHVAPRDPSPHIYLPIQPTAENLSKALLELIFAAHALAKRHVDGFHCKECDRFGAIETPSTHIDGCTIGRVYKAIDRVERSSR